MSTTEYDVRELVKFAPLSAKKRKSLPGSDFGYVDSDGKGHFPLHDRNHVEKANQLFKTHSFPNAGAKAQTARKIKARAKKHGIQIDPNGPVAKAASMSEPWLIALPFSEVAHEDFAEGRPLPFLKVGEHHFSNDYGDVHIKPEDLDTVVRNFKNNVRRQDLPLVNEEHLPAQYDENGPVAGPGAVGWIKDMYRDGDTVYAVPDWNHAGARIMADDRYRATSPELMLNWTDPETMEEHGLTAVGLALTNRPRMKNLAVQGKPLDPDTVAAAEPTVFAFAEEFDFVESADVHNDKALEGFSVAYAFPDRERLPLHSAEAVKGAKARFLTIEAEDPERDEAWNRVVSAASQHGVYVPASWRSLSATEVSRAWMAEPQRDPETGRYVAAGATTDNGDGSDDMADELDANNSQEEDMTDPAQAAEQEPVQAAEGAEDDGIEAAARELAAQYSPGDLDEMRNVLMAERVRTRAMEERLAMAEQNARAAQEELARMETARKLSEAQRRIDGLVRSGRITPAVVEKMSESMAKFAEDASFLDLLEALPANSAVNMSEVGSSMERPDSVTDTQAQHDAAIAYMKAKGQDTDMRKRGFSENYAAALREQAHLGYRPR